MHIYVQHGRPHEVSLTSRAPPPPPPGSMNGQYVQHQHAPPPPPPPEDRYVTGTSGDTPLEEKGVCTLYCVLSTCLSLQCNVRTGTTYACIFRMQKHMDVAVVMNAHITCKHWSDFRRNAVVTGIDGNKLVAPPPPPPPANSNRDRELMPPPPPPAGSQFASRLKCFTHPLLITHLHLFSMQIMCYISHHDRFLCYQEMLSKFYYLTDISRCSMLKASVFSSGLNHSSEVNAKKMKGTLTTDLNLFL